MADELLNLADEPVESNDTKNSTTASNSSEISQEESPTFKTPAEKKKYIHDLKKKKEEERKALLKAEREEKKRQQKELDRISGKTGRRKAVYFLLIVAILAGGGAYYYIKTPKKPIVVKPKAEVVNVKDSIAEGIDQLKSKLSELKDEVKPESKWGITGPCFIISHSSVKSEDYAKRTSKKLSYEGFSTGYYWIPDLTSGGNEYYKVYVGPFSTESDAIEKLEDVRKYSKRAYIVEIK